MGREGWRMKKKVIALLLGCFSLIGCVPQNSVQFTPASQVEAIAAKPPLSVYKSSINLGSNFAVVRLAYSPDGRYLAIGDAGSSTIVIWDVEQNHEQARIHTRSNEGQPTWPSKWLHWNPEQDIYWSPDGRLITNGVGNFQSAWKGDLLKTIEFWDPMTGKVVHELPAIAINGLLRFNQDGSKLLVHSGQFAKEYRYSFTVYDTHTWQSKDYDTDGVMISKLVWTSNEKVLVTGVPYIDDNTLMRLADGRIIPQGATVARLIDTSNKQEPITTILFPPHKAGEYGYQNDYLIPDYVNQRVVLIGNDGSLLLLDTRTMKIVYFIEAKQLQQPSNGRRGVDLSSNGRNLFLVQYDNNGQDGSLIFNLDTGQQLGHIASKHAWGLALNPNGKTLAMGRENEVLFYKL